MNRSRSEVMIFCSNRHKQPDESLNIYIGEEQLEQVTQFKYLGMELDMHLNFNSHIDRICGKVNQRTELLWRV